jgi:hypothetical protein
VRAARSRRRRPFHKRRYANRESGRPAGECERRTAATHGASHTQAGDRTKSQACVCAQNAAADTHRRKDVERSFSDAGIEFIDQDGMRRRVPISARAFEPLLLVPILKLWPAPYSPKRYGLLNVTLV